MEGSDERSGKKIAENLPAKLFPDVGMCENNGHISYRPKLVDSLVTPLYTKSRHRALLN